MVYIFLSIIIILNIAIIFRLFKKDTQDIGVYLSDFNKSIEKLEKTLKDEFSRSRKESLDNEKRLREEIGSLFKSFEGFVKGRMSEFLDSQNKNFKEFSSQLSKIVDTSESRIEKIREAVEKKLEKIQKDNSEKLEKMRETVDEKLQNTLEKRLGKSFKLVSERLEQVHKGLGEMQVLASGVGDLKKVLMNVKARGILGEVQLSNLLEQILSPDQYEKNIKTKKESGERVEFAIKIPSKKDDSKIVWLPIDAKFPLECYQELIEAQDNGDSVLIEKCSKILESKIKQSAKYICDKYLDPPSTTNFGILFLPLEGLYAEALRRTGLIEFLQREHNVVVAGPTTIAALLNSLQMGFRTLAIEKRSSEVWTVLNSVKTEFGKFAGILDRTHKKLQQASTSLESATTKTRTIEKKLDKVQELPMIDVGNGVKGIKRPE